MAEHTSLEWSISERVRTVLATMRTQRGLSDSELMSAIMEWFSQLDPVEQQNVLDQVAQGESLRIREVSLRPDGKGESNIL